MDQKKLSVSAPAGLALAEAKHRHEWLGGVHTGAVGRRRGKKGTGYSPSTLAGYERSLRYVLTPEFGARPACEIDDREWQTWVDRRSREGPRARASRTT
jgi:hypothetical protein